MTAASQSRSSTPSACTCLVVTDSDVVSGSTWMLRDVISLSRMTAIAIAGVWRGSGAAAARLRVQKTSTVTAPRAVGAAMPASNATKPTAVRRRHPDEARRTAVERIR